MTRINLTPVPQPPLAGSTNVRPSGLSDATKGGDGGAPAGASFGKMLTDLLSTTNDLAIESDQKAQDFLAGRSRNIHETMIAMEKAGIAFRFVHTVRNKAIEAYREIIRMQM